MIFSDSENRPAQPGDRDAIRNAYGKKDCLAWGTPLSARTGEGSPDKFRGCLLGGAAGDALGYAIEFWSEDRIFRKYGPEGIRDYALTAGLARISDDTQMTLFTANGLMMGMTRGRMRGIMGPMSSYIAQAYREWYKTQTEAWPPEPDSSTCWLCNVPGLYDRRAPGTTCMSAISAGCSGTPETPINHSKGCGGIMRVAPIGLYFKDPRMPILSVDLMAADAAALTHGHELGYIPAAMLAHIVHLLAHSPDISLEAAAEDGMEAMKRLFPDAVHLKEFLELMEKALELSRKDQQDLTAIHRLGEGWVAEETLAIALYCALKYRDDFDMALRASVNHNGDSDSTGAVTGNILGALGGLSSIPAKYQEKLELRDVILEIADDLFYDCSVSEYQEPETQREKAWYAKYVFMNYGGPGSL